MGELMRPLHARADWGGSFPSSGNGPRQFDLMPGGPYASQRVEMRRLYLAAPGLEDWWPVLHGGGDLVAYSGR